MLDGSINRVRVSFLTDTGASASVIRKGLLRQLKVSLQALPRAQHLLAANGATITVTDAVSLPIVLQQFTATHYFVVCDTTTWDVILDIDFWLVRRL